MLNQYLLPIIGLAGMIISYLFLRKTRDKKYLPALLLFIITFAVDLATGIKNIPLGWLIPVKTTFLALGWAFWFRAFSLKNPR